MRCTTPSLAGAAITAVLAASTTPACHPGSAGPGSATRPSPSVAAPRDTAPLPRQVEDTAHAQVLAELEAYYRDFSARDWDAFASHFWPDATLSAVWQPPGEDGPRVVITALADFVDQAPSGPGSREIFEERMLDAEVRVQGDLAHAWATFAARFGDPGEVAEWQGIDAFTLMRHDGRWRIVALAYTDLPSD